MVPKAGLEPARLLRTLDFESSASTNSAIRAVCNDAEVSHRAVDLAKLSQKRDKSNFIANFVSAFLRDTWNSPFCLMQTAYIVYDTNVEEFSKLFCDRCIISSGGHIGGSLSIVADEEHKTLELVERICTFLLELNADRHSTLIAVGGGVTSDVCGLAAGIYKRGIKFEVVPTTLLAQVDAAYGGKNGVNLCGVKNALGLVRLPDAVHICREPLLTLPEREFRSGVAELLKTFILFDEDRYAESVALFSKLSSEGYSRSSLEAHIDEVLTLVREAASYKEKTVASDLYDNGLRRQLNLGHTLGHAIEWWQASSHRPDCYSHGEAVAIGIVAAARISSRMGLCSSDLALRLESDFKACSLPTELPVTVDELLPAMGNDKKMSGDGKLSFVLLKDLAEPVICELNIEKVSDLCSGTV